MNKNVICSTFSVFRCQTEGKPYNFVLYFISCQKENLFRNSIKHVCIQVVLSMNDNVNLYIVFFYHFYQVQDTLSEFIQIFLFFRSFQSMKHRKEVFLGSSTQKLVMTQNQAPLAHHRMRAGFQSTSVSLDTSPPREK